MYQTSLHHRHLRRRILFHPVRDSQSDSAWILRFERLSVFPEIGSSDGKVWRRCSEEYGEAIADRKLVNGLDRAAGQFDRLHPSTRIHVAERRRHPESVQSGALHLVRDPFFGIVS